MAEKQKLLFVCTANMDRSPTAEGLFRSHAFYEARSCGTSAFAQTPVDEGQLNWADVVICMEEHHRQALALRFPEVQHMEVHVLDVPDIYARGEAVLVDVLRAKLAPWLHRES